MAAKQAASARTRSKIRKLRLELAKQKEVLKAQRAQEAGATIQ